ncbi:hypothetical protein FEM48_Zijuj01G0116900 [Ziziphus jujuba var. spinosa]|uniref:Uncharacterized protein n=1 Tax=Ziziphus jujuba var. spinosa TaxID=714518 RepID=A0A978W125_ZIZJJ|nr:hypothetical protein FEM48_Zijuj01G0116900 [Ziziphus jujuba var. spinosa]
MILKCRLGGNITYNGKPISNAMKRNLGLLTPDDVLCSHLRPLIGGNTMYFGNGGAELMDYFARIRYAPSVAMNPSDLICCFLQMYDRQQKTKSLESGLQRGGSNALYSLEEHLKREDTEPFPAYVSVES